MSNEYKEWLKDKAVEILLDNQVLDKIEDIYLEQNEIVVWGMKEGRRLIFRVWLDDEDWKFEEIK